MNDMDLRFRVYSRGSADGRVDIFDTKAGRNVITCDLEYRPDIERLAEQLNVRHRLALAGATVDEGDVVELVADAERGDTGSVHVKHWPFASVPGGGRYRWRFIAHGSTAVYATDAAALCLRGRVVLRNTVLGPRRLVQLVDDAGTVVANVQALDVVRAVDGSELVEYLTLGPDDVRTAMDRVARERRP